MDSDEQRIDHRGVIRAVGLHKAFERGDGLPVRALRGLDLEVDAGEFVAVVGPSGSGKSTLINMLAGLDSVDSGTVAIAGHEMVGADEDARTDVRRDHIGIVFQQFNLIESLSALDNVALACRIGGASGDVARRAAHDLLALVALGTRPDIGLGSLSGGQRQRVAIARALANNPDVVLADEPTGALDSAGAAEIGELFQRLHSSGLAFVMVTHDPVLAGLADRVLHMTDGRLFGNGASPA